jgi:hypothetical protein
MPNVKVQIPISKMFWILVFDIHLTFACLREAASAKAGILTFGFANIHQPSSTKATA